MEGTIGPMLWFVETPDGLIQVASPIPDNDTRNYTKNLAEAMSSYFQERNATRYVVVAECWTHYPHEKNESIMIRAEDGCQRISARREIVRPTGRKPYLTYLDYIDFSPATNATDPEYWTSITTGNLKVSV
jgi:hypothetical protein